MGQLTFQATLGGAVNLAGPNTASTVTFTLPSADGTNGQFLQTNGSGTWSFATPSQTYPNSGIAVSTGSAWGTSTFAGDATQNLGYLNIPQNSQSAAYTLVLSDAGKHIYHPSTDANARTFTIPANASVAYPIGTAITFANMSAQNVTIAITSDTLYFAGSGTTGSRTLAQYGTATALKLTSTTWIISGAGLT